MKPLHILLIEDSATYAQLVRSMLSAAAVAKFEVVWASDLASGIKLLDGSRYDAILLDLSLPDSQGLDTLKSVNLVAGGLPILILSSHDQEELTLEALHVGAADYLVKSEVNANWLARSIVYAIERNRTDLPDSPDDEESSPADAVPLAFTTVEKLADTLVLKLSDRRLVGFVELDEFKQRVLQVARREKAVKLMLDLGVVEYVSNVAIAMLLTVHKNLQNRGCELVLTNVSPQVYEHFTMRRFNHIFEIQQIPPG